MNCQKDTSEIKGYKQFTEKRQALRSHTDHRQCQAIVTLSPLCLFCYFESMQCVQTFLFIQILLFYAFTGSYTALYLFLFAFDIQTAVLSSELALIWQDLKSHPVDSTLSRDEKVQLHRQTFSEVLHICEQLFLRYLHLAETLRRRGVFSDCANRRRLAAQLAVDCTGL